MIERGYTVESEIESGNDHGIFLTATANLGRGVVVKIEHWLDVSDCPVYEVEPYIESKSEHLLDTLIKFAPPILEEVSPDAL